MLLGFFFVPMQFNSNMLINSIKGIAKTLSKLIPVYFVDPRSVLLT